MNITKGLEWTFDTVADKYAKMRPGYPAELYQKIFDYCPVDETSKLMEIGIGGGQATLPFLQKNCSVTAVEYGEDLSELCRKKFKSFPGFKVITSRFEDVSLEDGAYDLVYSASAFHWIPEKIGYNKVYKTLKQGGVFARFANHPYPCKDEPELHMEIEAAYEKYYDTYYDRKSKKPAVYTEEDARERAYIAEKYGFTEITYAVFSRIREFTASEYIELLGTYSDHIAIEEPIRSAFFKEIEEAINHHGGVLKLYDNIDLQLAMVPDI